MATRIASHTDEGTKEANGDAPKKAKLSKETFERSENPKVSAEAKPSLRSRSLEQCAQAGARDRTRPASTETLLRNYVCEGM